MPTERGEVPTVVKEPQEIRMREYRVDEYNALIPVMDEFLSGIPINTSINTAHDTYITLVASLPTGKEARIKSLIFTNREAYSVRVEIYDETTKILEIIMATNSSFGLSTYDLCGFTASTSIKFKTQSGNAWSAGTTVSGGYVLKDT